jgi:hypothetical protein
MTTTTETEISPLARSDHERAARAFAPVAIASVAVTIFFAVFRADSAAETLSVAAFDLVAGALLFALVVPRALRHDSAGGRALTMSILAVLLVLPAFWSGLPLLLGAAGALLGYAGKRAATGSGTSIAALVLGLLAVVSYLAFYVSDWIAHPGASWWS